MTFSVHDRCSTWLTILLVPVLLLAWAVKSPAIAMAAPLNVSVLERRFAEIDPKYDKLFQFTKQGAFCWEQLKRESLRLERMLSFTEFCNTVSRCEKPLTRDDYSMLWLAFAKSQRPSIDQFELSSLHKTRKSKLESAHVYYEVERTLNGSPSQSAKAEFAFSGGKLFYDAEVQKQKPRTRSRSQLTYDLNEMVVVKAHGQEIDQWRKRVAEMALRGPLDHVERFIDGGNPLLLQSLLPTATFSIQSDIKIESLAVDCCLSEIQEEFAGKQCLVLGNYHSRYYVCPELGYALVGYEKGVGEFEKDGRLLLQQPWFVQMARNFQEEQTGLFFPRQIEQLVESHDYKRSLRVDVTSVAFNQDIDDSKFSGLTPDQEPGGRSSNK